jgi:hypothetical protein
MKIAAWRLAFVAAFAVYSLVIALFSVFWVTTLIYWIPTGKVLIDPEPFADWMMQPIDYLADKSRMP